MPSESTFDLSYLHQVFQGNRALVIQIVELFLQQVPDYVKAMEGHLKEGNYAEIHPLAHKSKSSTAMLGLKVLESILIEIEQNGKASRYGDLPVKVQALREQLHLCTKELEVYLAQQKQ